MIVFSDLIIRGRLSLFQFNLEIYTKYFTLPQGIMYQNRWYKNWGNSYYFKADGTRATSEVVEIDGSNYYFDNEGIMKTNFQLKQEEKGCYSFFGKDGKEYMRISAPSNNSASYSNTDAKTLQFMTKNGINK